MRLSKIAISGYGKLKDLQIELKEGINVIYGPNESGKSTLKSFIFNMLFGGTAEGSKRTIYTDEYSSYIPWNSIGYEGSMEVVVGNETFHFYRNFAKGSEKLTVLNTKTGEDAKNFFKIDQSRKVERLDMEYFGLNETTIKKNFVIEPLGFFNFNSEVSTDIRDKLNNKITTNEDNLSLEKLIENIEIENDYRGLKRKYKVIQRDIKDLEVKLKKSNSRLEHKIDMEYLSEIRARISELKTKYENISNHHENNLNEEENKNKSLFDEYMYLTSRLETLNPENYGNIELKAAISNRNKLVAEIEDMEKNLVSSKVIILLSILFTSIMATVSYFYLRNLIISALLIPISLSIMYVLNLLRRNKNKNTLSEKYAELDAVQGTISDFGVDVDSSYYGASDKNSIQLEIIHDRISQIENIIDVKNYIDDIPTNKENDLELEKLKSEIDDLVLEKARLLERIKINDEIFSEEIANIEAMELLRAEENELNEKIRVIDTSKGILKKLSKEKFVDRASDIGTIGSKYMEILTGGKYSNILVNPEGEILLKDIYTNRFIDVNNLSKGTIDQVYLSYRLALIESLEMDFPIFIDDGLVLYDDKRNSEALALLLEISKERQIILFTSHYRDIESLELLKGKFNLINLGA